MIDRNIPLSAADEREIADSIERSLDREIQLYQRYRELLSKEREALSSFQSEAVQALADAREAIYEELLEIERGRQQLVSQVSGTSRMRLSECIERILPGHAARLLPKVAALREAVSTTQAENQEFGHVVTFALNMVSGLASLLWSATQSIVRSYTKAGQVKESTHPSTSRASTVLKKA